MSWLASPIKGIPYPFISLTLCHLCTHARDPWRGLDILNTVRSSAVGHHFYGRYSRRVQKPIPGEVRSVCLQCLWDVCATRLNSLDLHSQTCPLDLYTDCFYENRKEAIDSRVQLLSEASSETLHSMLEDVWTSQEGKVCSLVSWERFSSLQQAQVFIIFDAVCKVYIKLTAFWLHAPQSVLT